MNVSRRLPPTISHVRLDGRPRSTVPSLGAASRRPPPSDAIVPASTCDGARAAAERRAV